MKFKLSFMACLPLAVLSTPAFAQASPQPARPSIANMVSKILLSIAILCAGACTSPVEQGPGSEEVGGGERATAARPGATEISEADVAAQDPGGLD